MFELKDFDNDSIEIVKEIETHLHIIVKNKNNGQNDSPPAIVSLDKEQVGRLIDELTNQFNEMVEEKTEEGTPTHIHTVSGALAEAADKVGGLLQWEGGLKWSITLPNSISKVDSTIEEEFTKADPTIEVLHDILKRLDRIANRVDF